MDMPLRSFTRALLLTSSVSSAAVDCLLFPSLDGLTGADAADAAPSSDALLVYQAASDGAADGGVDGDGHERVPDLRDVLRRLRERARRVDGSVQLDGRV